MSSNYNGSNFLETDYDIVENNLRFINDPQQEINKLFKEEETPTKLVKPSPGFCIKTHVVGTDKKFFINVCQTESIPAPKDITESELKGILESDEPQTYRVPMSIGEVRKEADKQGEEVQVCDIAINPVFFRKVENVTVFKHFAVTLFFEGIEEKYGIVCVDQKIVLKNRKVFGTLQTHCIRQREIDEKIGKAEIKTKSLMEEISRGPNEPTKKPLIETLSSFEHETKEPEYILFKRKEKMNVLVGKFKFPDLINVKDLTVDLNADRVIVESKAKHYLLDIFLPVMVHQEKCFSTFDKDMRMLTINMPILGG